VTELSTEQRERASRIRFILLDADGVLTDGRIYLDSAGQESRAFSVLDGFGIRLGQRAGLQFGVMSGRKSEVVSKRAAELGIEEVHQGVLDKLSRFEELQARLGLSADEVCFVGDDLIDLPVLRRVGLSAAPSNAVAEVLQAVHLVTDRPGGKGAVRELVDLILHASGRWESATQRFLR